MIDHQRFGVTLQEMISDVRWLNFAPLAFAVLAMEFSANAQCLRYSVDLIQPQSCGGLFYPTIGASAISEIGEMTGGGGTCGGPNSAFAWYGMPPPVYLPMPQGMSGFAADMNSARQIVGFMQPKGGGGNTVPFLYQNGVLSAMSMLPGDSGAACYAINESGIACGASGFKAVVWNFGRPVALTLPIGPNSVATGISSHGVVSGWMGEGGVGSNHAFVWSENELVDLGYVLPGAFQAFATSVNDDASAVCGYSSFSDPKYVYVRRAFYWKGGKAQDLGMISPWINCYAHSINDDGIIVGHCTGEAAGGTGFVWKGGVIYDLKDLVPPELNLTFLNAASINNAGQIAATGFYPNPSGPGAIYVAMRLNPIPPLTGDLNCDWQVNVPDLLGVISAWGPCPPAPPQEPFTKNCHADFNDDGVVNHHDIIAMVLNWTQ